MDDVHQGESRNECTNSNSKNYFRLVKFVMVEGTKALQECIEQHLPDGVCSLQQAIRNNDYKITILRKNGFISNAQYRVLCPQNGRNVDTTQFDINTWVVLARNVTTTDLPKHKWDIAKLENFDDNEDGWEFDVMRIRLIRNRLFHMTAPDMDDIEFTWLWREAVTASRRLNDSIDIEPYLQMDIVNSDEMARYQLQIEVGYLEDVNHVIQRELRHRRLLFVVFMALIVLLLVALAVGIPVTWSLARPDECHAHQQTIRVGREGVLSFIDRSAWKARTPTRPLRDLKIPVKYAVIGHTAFNDICVSIDGCCDEVRTMQTVDMNFNNFSDIFYHYMIDSSGVVYEGRSANKQAEFTAVNKTRWKWEPRILFISLMGHFMTNQPTPIALTSLTVLLEYLQLPDIGLLQSDYVLYPLCHITDTLSPGKQLYDKLTSFPHWQDDPTSSYCNFTFPH